MICFAHRGASGHAPENTLLSMKTALAMGAAWIELDVFCVRGELLVIHDSRVDRTTNGTGSIHRLALTVIRSLDAGAGERIPLLREVFDTLNGNAGINIELKGENTARPVAALIHEYVRQGNYRPDQFIVSSFNHQELMRFKGEAPDIRTGANIFCLPVQNARFAQHMGVDAVHIHKDCVTRAFVEDTHDRGLAVYVFTLNHEEEVSDMERMGADGFFTNFPELGQRFAPPSLKTES